MIATGTFSKVGLPVLASGESEFLCPMACGMWQLASHSFLWKMKTKKRKRASSLDYNRSQLFSHP